MKIKRPSRLMGRVEMIPLIDCIFLLLISFIYATFSMTLDRGIKVELPQAATASRDVKESVRITIGRDGSVYWGAKRVTPAELGSAVRAAAGTRPEMLVSIGADRKAEHGKVVEVLDTVRGAGVSRVSIEAVETAP